MIAGREIALEAARRVLDRARAAQARGRPSSFELVAESVFHERERLTRGPKTRRYESDRAFVDRVARELGALSPDALLGDIVHRYAHEIEGHFDPKVYRFATSVLPLALTALLNGTRARDALRRVPELSSLSDRVAISGPTASLTRLAQRGALVFTPTHVSNLDSLLFGYSIFRSGLPPVAYGAGLNLFESRVLGYFMHNLGAYSVDRAKSDPLYRAVLKEYATVLLERGEHGLFFPGGTRSRSFALESRLKKGLLGTTLAAFRNNLVAKRARPRIFIVPATCSYPLVLEGYSLAEDYLLRAGRGQYVHLDRDDSDNVRFWLAFFEKLLALDAEVHVRFGAPLDPFGNHVDDDGQSRDRRGRLIDPAGYLEQRGAIVEDPARDAAYTETLEREILRAYERDNVAQPTWLLAFCALEYHRQRHPAHDLFRLLRELLRGTRLPLEPVRALFSRALDELSQREHEGRVTLGDELREGASAAFDRALALFATWHERPVLRLRDGALELGEPSLLYYYRNRLDALGLLGAQSLLAKEQP